MHLYAYLCIEIHSSVQILFWPLHVNRVSQLFEFVHSYVTFVVSFVVVDQGFVLAVTMVREAVDEVRRCRRDKEMNSQLYSKLTMRGDHADARSSDSRC